MTLVCLHALCLSSESSKFFKCSLRSMSMIDLIIGCWIEAHPSSNRTTIWIIKGRIDILMWTFWYGQFDRDISDRDFLIWTFHTHSHRDFLIGTFSLTLIGTHTHSPKVHLTHFIHFSSNPFNFIQIQFNYLPSVPSVPSVHLHSTHRDFLLAFPSNHSFHLISLILSHSNSFLIDSDHFDRDIDFHSHQVTFIGYLSIHS